LSSYAVVTNYFRNHITISTVFDEYCNYFRIPYVSHLDSERSSGNHLNQICGSILKWKGYQMIDYLHNHSYNHLFSINKNFFSAWIYSLDQMTENQYNGLLDYLKMNESLANFTTQLNEGYHSQTCGIDENGSLFVHNTAANPNPQIKINAILDYKTIQECIVYKRT
jgi:hypothetical protein